MIRRLFAPSLYRQLFLWFFGVSLAVLLASVFLTRVLSWRSDTLESLGERALQEVPSAYRSGQRRALNRLHEEWRDRLQTNLYVEHRGEVLCDFPMPPPVRDHLRELDASVLRRTLLRGDQLLALPLTIDGDSDFHVILFQARNQNQQPWPLTAWLAVQIGLSVIAIAVMSALLARSFSRPLRATDEAVRRIAAGDLHTRIDSQTTARSDEFGRLAHGVNEMAARIGVLVRDRDRLLHDVSHELRSPLARLRILLELARTEQLSELSKQLERADKEIDRMDHLVDEILSDARIQRAPKEVRFEKIELGEITAAAVASAAVEAEAQGVDLQFETKQPIYIQGNEELLIRAIDNLLRNSIRFSSAGDRIEVCLAREEHTALLSIADQGPGVPDAELDRIFEPFFRIPGEERGKGYGLGMALVQRIADAHGATLQARNLVPRGLVVSLQFKLEDKKSAR